MRFFIIFFVFAVLSLQLHAQQTVDSARKYVKVNVANNGLMCPFLSPTLEKKLKAIEGAENVKIDRVKYYVTLNIPSGSSITSEQIKKMATEIGYPVPDVSVIIADSPFEGIGK